MDLIRFMRYIARMKTQYKLFQAIKKRLAREKTLARTATLRANPPCGIQGILEGHVPSIERAAVVANALGIFFRISATESGTGASPIDPELIGLLTERIMRIHEECGAEITPRQAVELAATVYNRIVGETKDKDDRFVRVGEYIVELRQTLSSAKL